jgi:hypothetical protein
MFTKEAPWLKFMIDSGGSLKFYTAKRGQSPVMLFSKHDTASCDQCGSTVWYGLKKEPTGWKVFYVCDLETGCGSEWRVGWIGLAEVKSIDDAYQRAESMWTERESRN